MKSGSLNISGMPYRRSGHAGGKSVSMISMLVLLMAALLVLPSCFDDDTETVTETVKETVTETVKETVEAEPGYDEIGPGHEVGEENCYEDGDRDGMIAGTEMGDCIKGEEGNDSIKGMGGDDMLDGGPGNDTLYGGADNDELIGGPGNNTLDGGPDTDIAVYKNALRVVVNLGDNMARVKHSLPEDVDELVEMGDSGIGTDTLMNIENVKGTHGDDIINGDGNANLLKGLDGADTINGHGDDDTIIPNRPMPPTEETDTVMDGVDVVDGGGHGAKGDTISYEGEDDSIVVNVTLDTSNNNTEPGFVAEVKAAPNANPPTPRVPAFVQARVGSVDDKITVMNIGTEDAPNLVTTIENITGGAGNDMLTGDARDNTLTGGAGNDTLRGEFGSPEMGGDDTLNGGAGADMLYGGPGNDTLNGGDDDDTTMEGGLGNDTLNGGKGDDTLTGGAGNDTYIITKGDAGDTIAEFAAGDKIYLKGFMGNEKLQIDSGGTQLQVVVDDSDKSNIETMNLVTITDGADLIRLGTDVMFMN